MAITDPTDIAGCVLWLDFDDVGSLTVVSDEITQANDKSGNGNNFIPIVGGVGPDYQASTLNGRGVAIWPATNTGLRRDSLDLPIPTTWFVVGLLKSSTPGVINCIFATGAGGTPGYAGLKTHPPGPPATDALYFDGVSGYQFINIPLDSPWYTTIVWESGAGSDGRLDGVAGFTNANLLTTGFTGGFQLGRANHVESGLGNAPGSYIAEVIAYDTALSSGDIADVEDYLYNKWFVSSTGITGTPSSVASKSATGTITATTAVTGTPSNVVNKSATGTIGGGTVAITGVSSKVILRSKTGVVGGDAPNPVKIADRGVRNNSGTGNVTLTLTNPTAIAVGNYLVTRISVDNSGGSGARPGVTVSDARNGTWSVGTGALQDPGAASAGVTCYLAYVKVTTVYQASDAISYTWGGSAPRSAIVIEEWANLHPTTVLAVAEVQANNLSTTADPAVSRTPTAVGQLMYAAAALEGFSSSWGAQDSDTTGGSWGDLTKDEANTGTAGTSVSVYGGYKVVTSTAAQTWNNSLSDGIDWAAVAVVFAKAVATPVIVGSTGSVFLKSDTGQVATPIAITGTPSSVAITAGTGAVTGHSSVSGTPSSVVTKAGTGTVTGHTAVTGTSSLVTSTSAVGQISTPVTITGTSSLVTSSSGTGTVTGHASVAGTSSSVVTKAGTGTVTGHTAITGVSSLVSITAGTGTVTSVTAITGTSSLVSITAGTGQVGTGASVLGTPALVTSKSNVGLVVGHASVTGTSSLVTSKSASGTITGSAAVTGTPSLVSSKSSIGQAGGSGSVTGISAVVSIKAWTGQVTAHTPITGVSSLVVVKSATGTVLVGPAITGTSSLVSSTAGTSVITGHAAVTGNAALVNTIGGLGTGVIAIVVQGPILVI